MKPDKFIFTKGCGIVCYVYKIIWKVNGFVAIKQMLQYINRKFFRKNSIYIIHFAIQQLCYNKADV